MADAASFRRFSFKDIEFQKDGPPQYEQLSQFIKAAIHEGRLRAGDRLPALRQLAVDLGISVTTVAATFNHLSEQKLVRSEVGRGTFVTAVTPPPPPSERVDPWTPIRPPVRDLTSRPWRRRALMNQGSKLRSRYPDALDCSTGRPD